MPLTQAECRAERIVALVDAFRDGAVLSTRQIAGEFGVSKRTAERLILSVQVFVALGEDDIPATESGSRTRVYRKARF